MADEETQATNPTPTWAEKIIAAHNSVASGYVSHAVRIRANHYFCWQEDDDHDFLAGDVHDLTSAPEEEELIGTEAPLCVQTLCMYVNDLINTRVARLM